MPFVGSKTQRRRVLKKCENSPFFWNHTADWFAYCCLRIQERFCMRMLSKLLSRNGNVPDVAIGKRGQRQSPRCCGERAGKTAANSIYRTVTTSLCIGASRASIRFCTPNGMPLASMLTCSTSTKALKSALVMSMSACTSFIGTPR